ncbi:MAG: undecaprenyl diphosphate synthase family protein, partial [Gaiellaceae bacterium]
MRLLTKLRTITGFRPSEERRLPDAARSVAIIMDGNGRWARRRRLPVAAGHRAGTRALRRTVEAAIDLGVESLCVYAFSTENWSRPSDEIDALMEIFVETIER